MQMGLRIFLTLVFSLVGIGGAAAQPYPKAYDQVYNPPDATMRPLNTTVCFVVLDPGAAAPRIWRNKLEAYIVWSIENRPPDYFVRLENGGFIFLPRGYIENLPVC